MQVIPNIQADVHLTTLPIAVNCIHQTLVDVVLRWAVQPSGCIKWKTAGNLFWIDLHNTLFFSARSQSWILAERFHESIGLNYVSILLYTHKY